MEKYFCLSKNKVFVNGAKHSVVLDLNNGSIARANPSAARILDLANGKMRISEASRALADDISGSVLVSFLEELSNQDVICFSDQPIIPEVPETSAKLDLLWIEVTSSCNLRCIHCYADGGPRQDQGLPFDVLIKIIDDAASLGCKAIQFTGGECVLRSDLLDLIKYAKSKGFKFIEIFTNGTILNEETIKFLAKEGVHVAMSLHSFRAKTQETITGVPGSFDQAINCLKLLLAYNVATRCETIAMKQNEDDLESTYLFLSQLGIQTRPADPIRPCGRGLSMENWPEDYGNRTIQTQPCFIADRDIYDKSKRGNSCWFGKASITSNGDVIPCIFARDQVVGNVLKNSLKDIVLGEKMQRLWLLSHDSVEVCKDCEYRYICGDCRPWAYGFTGNINAKYPKCTYNPYTGEWGKAEDALVSSLHLER